MHTYEECSCKLLHEHSSNESSVTYILYSPDHIYHKKVYAQLTHALQAKAYRLANDKTFYLSVGFKPIGT